METNLAYSSTAAFPGDFLSFNKVGSVANSSDADKIASKVPKVVSSSKPRKKVVAVEFRIPSFVNFLEPYHQRP